MINIGNRTYLNLPVIIIVSACSCIFVSQVVSVSVAGCVLHVCVVHGSAATTLATDRGNMSDSPHATCDIFSATALLLLLPLLQP